MKINPENIKKLLVKLHDIENQEHYGAGNLINLLLELDEDLTQYDFSRLKIEQACLQGKGLRGVNLSECTISRCALTEDFSTIASIDFYGNRAVAGTTSGTINVWNIDESERIATLTGHNDWVWAIAFSPDGKLIASGSGDRTVRLWDLSKPRRKQRHLWSNHEGRVRAVAFSPDGTLLASGGEDGKVNLYNLEDPQLITSLNKQGWANSIKFSPDSDLLAVGGQQGTVTVWDVSDRQDIQNIKNFNDFTRPIRSIKFSPYGQFLAIAGDAKEIWLVNVNNWECVQRLTGYKKASIRRIDFTPDGDNIAGGGLDSQIRIWNVRTGKILETLTGHDKQVRVVAFNSDRENLTLLTGAEDQTLRLWEIEKAENKRLEEGYNITGKCIKIIQGYANPIWSVAFSPTEPVLITGDEENQVLRWQLDREDLTKVIPEKLEDYQTFDNPPKIITPHSNLIRKLAFNKDGSWLASGSYDGTVIALELNQKNAQGVYKGLKKEATDSNDRVISVTFHPTKEIIAICYYYGEKVDIWDFEYEEILQTIDLLNDEKKRSRGRDVAFSPDGKILAISSEEHFIRLYDWENQTYLSPLEGHQAPVWSIAFREDPENNEILASCDGNGEIRLWNLETYQSRKLEGHTKRLRSIAFSPDARRLVSGGDDETVKIWDLKSGECLKTFPVPQTWIWSVSFSHDGKMIAHGNDNGTAQVWDIETEQCISTLRPDRPYEGMNITGIKGLTSAQIEMFKQLGAIDENEIG